MTLLESPIISTFLALAATFLTLAALVQIIQELYKFLTSSKSRAYKIALKDFLGPWANELFRPGAFPDLTVRGPFQWARLRPRGRILPMKKEDLVSAMERTAPPWVQRVLDQLNLEEKMQSGKPDSPSPSWIKVLQQIGNVERGTSGFLTAIDIAGFLKTWGHAWDSPDFNSGTPGRKRRLVSEDARSLPVRVGTLSAPALVDAARMMKAFRKQFLSHVDAAAERFPFLEENFDYAYQRRNMRHSFLIALLLALACNFPFEQLYMKASGLSLDQASKLAEGALALQKQVKNDSLAVADTATINRLLAAGKTALATVGARTTDPGHVNYLVDLDFLQNLWEGGYWAILRYLFGCLVTAFLVCFGAPVWNDIASALLRLQKGQGKKKGENDNG